MKNIKKAVSILLIFAIVFALSACGEKLAQSGNGSTPAPQSVKMNIACLSGPTGIGMVKLMSDKDEGTAKNDYRFSLVGDPTEIVAGMTSGAYDIAAAPVNLAATLYNKLKGNIQVLAINTKGVLYILENGNTISSLADLAGKTLYATGQGSTPEYILSYLLEKNGLADRVTVEYKASHDELAALAAAGKVTVAMLPEPKVTSAVTKNPDLRIALNLTEEFERVSGESLVQGVIIAKKDFVSANPEAVRSFLAEYKASVDFTAASLDTTAALCEKYGVIPKAPMAKKAIPNCNIVYIDGAEMKSSVAANLQLFFDADPKSVGGKLPADDFYYGV